MLRLHPTSNENEPTSAFLFVWLVVCLFVCLCIFFPACLLQVVDGASFYLVRWHGCSEAEDTWEPVRPSSKRVALSPLYNA
jgi:hypothetical protein